MRLTIDPKSSVPLHAQIAEGIRLAIARGELAPGDQLPTVRQLSVDLKVNSNTVARVYAELERAGVVEAARGRGTFVRSSVREQGTVRARRLQSLCRSFAVLCAGEGYSLAEVADAIRALAKNKEGSR
ncbi:MAG TPA: GntR family transcriptional regulator [Polyangiaceae bacterium]|nr:GntR family transcriptional regulator [Polyangiaceae bacterium]